MSTNRPNLKKQNLYSESSPNLIINKKNIKASNFEQLKEESQDKKNDKKSKDHCKPLLDKKYSKNSSMKVSLHVSPDCKEQQYDLSNFSKNKKNSLSNKNLLKKKQKGTKIKQDQKKQHQTKRNKKTKLKRKDQEVTTRGNSQEYSTYNTWNMSSNNLQNSFIRPTKISQKSKHSEQLKQKSKLIISLPNPKQKQINLKTVRTTKRKDKIKTLDIDFQSHREYCIVKGKFIPVETTTQRKIIDQIFQQTACTTSPEISYKKIQKIQIDQQSLNNHIKDESKHVEVAEIGISTIKTQLNHYEVLVKAAQQQIGIQYSDRCIDSSKNIVKEEEQLNSLKQVIFHIQSLNNKKNQVSIDEVQLSERSQLLQTIMKLQFLKEGISQKEQILSSLNKDQKDHFRKVLSSWMNKLKSPRIQQIIKSNANRDSTEDGIEIERLKNTKLESKNSIEILKQKQKNQMQIYKDQFEQLLMIRQSKQKNQFIVSLKSKQQIDTSVHAVLSTFSDIYCYIQMNYEQQILSALNSLYGLSYGDKYKCVSKFYTILKNNNKQTESLSISQRIKQEILNREYNSKIMPDSLFQNFQKQFSEEDDFDEEQEQDNQNSKFSYSFIHNKAVFDCLNELLVPYRPFYHTKGDPFPWTLVPLKCLTFYSIDNQSLETVVDQVQQKIGKISKNLCGLHLDHTQYKVPNYKQIEESGDWGKDIVFSLRRDKLTSSILQQSQYEHERDDSYMELQVQMTCVLYELSLFINQQLIKQVQDEFKFFFKKQQ